MRWLTPADYEFYGFWGPASDGRKAVEDHKFLLQERKEKYKNTLIDKDNEHVKTLKEKGWVVIPNFFTEEEKGKLLTVKASMEKNIQKGNVKDLKNSIIHLIRDPLLNVEKINDILFDERIIQICRGYLDTEPALTSVAARKSYVVKDAAQNNQFFHRDYNSLTKHLKVAFYLHDVDYETGPFTYVDKSNIKIPSAWVNQHYWHDQNIKDAYGNDSIKYLTAKFGDLIIADTRGFHKGLKPTSKERLAVHACYMIHPELTGRTHEKITEEKNWFKIRKEDFDKLNENQKPTADFLQIIDK